MYNIDSEFQKSGRKLALESKVLATELTAKIVNQGGATYILWRSPNASAQATGELIFKVSQLRDNLYPLYASRTLELAENIFKTKEPIRHRELLDLKNLKAIRAYKEILIDEGGLAGKELLHTIPVHVRIPELGIDTLREVGNSFWYDQFTSMDEGERFTLFNNIECKAHFDLICELILFFSAFEHPTLDAQALFSRPNPYADALDSSTWNVLTSSDTLTTIASLARHFYKDKGQQIIRTASRDQLALLGSISWTGINFSQIKNLMPMLEENVALAYRQLPSSMRSHVWSPEQLLTEVDEYFGGSGEAGEKDIAARFLSSHNHFLKPRLGANSSINILTAEALLLKLLLNAYGLSKAAEFYSAFLAARAPLALFARFVADSEAILEAMPLDWWLAIEHREDE